MNTFNVLMLGGSGFVGRHFKKKFDLFSNINLISPTSKQLDLRDEMVSIITAIINHLSQRIFSIRRKMSCTTEYILNLNTFSFRFGAFLPVRPVDAL
jgi:hypothetical protein